MLAGCLLVGLLLSASCRYSGIRQVWIRSYVRAFIQNLKFLVSSFSALTLLVRSEKVKLRGLDCAAYKMCQCAVLVKDQIIICNVFGSYKHFVKMVEHLSEFVLMIALQQDG